MMTQKSKNVTLTQDDVNDVLEKYGTYQRRMFLLLTLPVMFSGVTSMSTVIIFDIPEHR